MSGQSRTVLVTGASRGVGRGVARAFGSQGDTVYITGREAGGALADAAREVTEQGGTGIAIACDHRDDEQVASLFQTIHSRSGGLDVLVNNAAAVYPDILMAPGGFWEKPLRLVDMIDVGLRSAYVASYHAARMMAPARSGLIASISFYGAVSYFHGPAYGAAKGGTDKMMADMAVELTPHQVTAVSIWPGFVRTEAVAAIPEDQVPPSMASLWPLFERPEFTGLVIAALHADPHRLALSGQSLIGAELGERYGIRDLDGKTPVSFRQTMGAPAMPFTPAGQGGTVS